MSQVNKPERLVYDTTNWKVVSIDSIGPGGAYHKYRVRMYDKGVYIGHYPIEFQHGPVQESGVNGVTNETLLAIVIDRLQNFQGGPYKCDENQKALEHANNALIALQDRTFNRIARGVEGTNKI